MSEREDRLEKENSQLQRENKDMLRMIGILLEQMGGSVEIAVDQMMSDYQVTSVYDHAKSAMKLTSSRKS